MTFINILKKTLRQCAQPTPTYFSTLTSILNDIITSNLHFFNKIAMKIVM